MNEMPQSSPVRRYFPVALSALVYPGIGQMAQKRWVAGAFFLLAFTGLFIWFGVNAYQTLVIYYSFISPESTIEPTPVPMSRILIPFGLDFLVFLVNVFDAWFACRRTPASPSMPTGSLPMPAIPGTPATPPPPGMPPIPPKP